MAARQDIMAGRAFVELYLKREGLTRGLQGARQSLTDFSNAANALGRQMLAMGIAGGTGAMFAAKHYADFDDQMRAVKAAVGGTADEFERLTKLADELGRKPGFTGTGVGAFMLELGRAGFNPREIEDMTLAVMNLSRATGTNGATSAGIMSSALRQFQLDASQATRVADGFTAAANMTFNSVESLGEALSYAGPVANDFGMQIEEVLAILGTLGNVGIQGSEGGTAVRRLLTLSAAEAAKMSQIFGVSFRDARGNARPLIDILEDVHNKTKGLGTAVRAAKFNEAFGILGITSASALGKASGSTRQLLKDLLAARGVAAKTSEEMDAGPGGAWRRMIGAADAAARKLGEVLSPSFVRATNVGMAFANTISTIAANNKELVTGFAHLSAGLVVGGAALLALAVGLRVAAAGLGVLRVALIPAAYGSGILLATLKNAGIATGTMIRGVQGIAGALTSGFVGSLKLANVGLGNVVAGGQRMATGLLGSAMSAGNSLRTGLINVLARVPAAFNTIVTASRSAFAGATTAASKFSAELRYWLGRPFEYFKAITPLFAQDLQLGIANAMARIRAASAQAAEGVRAAWTRATSAISGAVGSVSAYISSRFTSVASPLAAKVLAAWQSAMTAISTRAAAAWNAVANAVTPMLNRIRQRFAALVPEIGKDLARLAGYAASASRGVVSAFAWAGPAIARGLVAATSGAFARIRAMGAATAGMMGRGIGAGMSGLSGLLSGGAGLLGQLGIGAGGAMGRIAMIVPQIMLLASSMTMLINPATLMIAAIAAGIYVWTQYSAEGQAALAAVTEAFAPIVATAQQTFAGVSEAIKSGNLALAGKIAMAGLKLAAIDGMIALGNALVSSWGTAADELAGEMGSGGVVTPWQQTMETMGAIWDQWTVGVVRSFTNAMRTVTDKWKGTVEGMSSWLLRKSAEGGFWGGVAKMLTGVDMNKEQADAEIKRQGNIKTAENRVKQFSSNVEEAKRTGGLVNGSDQAAWEKALANAMQDLAKATGTTVDALAEAQAGLSDIIDGQFAGGVAAAVKKYADELDRDAEARAKNSEAHLPGWQKIRGDAANDFNRLRGQAADENFGRQMIDGMKGWAEVLWGEGKKLLGVAGGGKAGADAKGVLEAKSLGATFSAAAAIAMGRGGSGGNPQERAAKAAEKQVDISKEIKAAVGKLPDALKEANEFLQDVVNNTKKFTARAK